MRSIKSKSFLGLGLLLGLAVGGCWVRESEAKQPLPLPVVVYVEYLDGVTYKHIVLGDGTPCIRTEEQVGSYQAAFTTTCSIK